MIREHFAPLKIALFFCMAFLSSTSAKSIKIGKTELFSPTRLGPVELFHKDDGRFYVVTGNEKRTIQNCFVDKEIRNISNERLGYILGTIKDIEIDGQKQTFVRVSSEDIQEVLEKSESITELNEEESSRIISQLASGAYLSINRMSDGEYSVCLKMRLPGGGLWGAAAGCWLGKFVASAVCHSAIWAVGAVVSVVATPAVGGIVVLSLESTLGATIETVSTTAAVAGGIALAVATGPV